MKVGILGGGQLSYMLALSAKNFDISFLFYVETHKPELDYLGKQIIADMNCMQSLQQFINQVDIITFENENIPESTLTFLDKQANTIFPCTDAIRITQDRLKEKNMIQSLGIPTNNYYAVDNREMLNFASENLGFPFILKQRTNGYDGKGQIHIKNINEMKKLLDEQLHHLIAEAFVPFDRELSIIMTRDQKGQFVSYDIAENQHINGILFRTYNKTHDSKQREAENYLRCLLDKLNYVGTCAMEFFQVGKQLLANEIAPRVHNSGHWTIEGTHTSQFENHIRAITNIPLGTPNSIGSYAMYNLVSQIPTDLNLYTKLFRP